jgi:preprotein translocase subunit YajC
LLRRVFQSGFAFLAASAFLPEIYPMLISPAFAQSAGGSAGIGQLLPFLLIFVVFYFFLIRPQQRRAKEHKAMIAAIKRGDKIVTSGGITGVVTKAVDGQDTVEVEIAKDVKVNVMRSMIADKPSTETAKPKAKAKAKAKGKDK